MEATNKEKSDAKGARQFYADKIRAIHKLLSNADKFNAYSQHELEECKARLNQFSDSFDEKCFQLNRVDFEANIDFNIADENDEIESLCILLKAKLSKRIDELKQPIEDATSEIDVIVEKVETVLQPSIDEPFTYGIFNGYMNEWHRFSKRFKEEVYDKDEIGPRQKYEMLMQACQGYAKHIVVNADGNFVNADGNFVNAWQQLKNVFEDAYIQVDFCISKILETHNIDMPSAVNLQYIKNRGAKCAQILNNALTGKDYDYFLAVMMAGKVDQDTARACVAHAVAHRGTLRAS